MSASWKISLPCTKAEAEALEGDIAVFAMLDEPPVLVTSEASSDNPDAWRMDAYFEDRPGPDLVEAVLALVPSAGDAKPEPEPVEAADWVTISQQDLDPIRAGRFFVHTPAHRNQVPADAIAFEIDAGRAFGTGQHETTSGCLVALDRLHRQGAAFSNVADIGTGTGLLAFAAARLWPVARIIASDVDPIAIDVAAENAAINAIGTGRSRGRLELVVAPGMDHLRLKARAPYDLVIANILAGPLIDLARPIVAALAPGGKLILAGLLDHQAERVTAAYRRQGMMPLFRHVNGDWPTLVLRKRRRSR